MKSRSSHRARVLAGSIAALLAVQSAQAATVTWNAGTAVSTDGLWSTATNWTADTAPGNGDDLIFGGAANQINSNDIPLTSLGSVTLNSAGWAITLGSVTLNGGGLVANGTSTVGGAVTLGAAQTWSNSTGLLTVTGTVDAGSFGLTLAGAGDTTLSSAIANGAALIKNDAGILTLAGTNGFTSATINGGTIAGGTLTLSAGATALTSSATSAVNSNVTITTAAGTITSSGGTLTLGGTLDAGSLALTVAGAGNTTVSNAIANGTTLTKSGAGALTLGATNTYTGQTTVTVGTLNASATNALGTGAPLLVNGGTLALSTFSSTVGAVILTSGSITGSTGVLTGTSFAVESGSVSAVLAGSGATLTKTTAGTVTLSKFNTFDGQITINSGTLEFSGSAAGANNVYLSTQININGASTLRISGASGNIPIYDGRTYTFDAVGGGSILVGTGNYNAGTTAFTITTNGGAKDTIGLISTSGAFGLNVGVVGGTFNVALGSDATSDLTVTPIIANTGPILKTGAGRLTFSGVNTFSGQLTVQNGTLSIATINNASANGTLGNNALAVILGNTGAQTGTVSYTGATATSTKKFTMATGGTGAFDVTTGANTLTLSGIIDGSGALSKTGPGALTLTAANSFSGGLIVKAGMVNISTAAAVNGLGTGTVTIGDSANTGAAAELRFAGSGAFPAFTNPISVTGNGSGASTPTLSVLGFNPAFSGAVTLGNNLNVVSNNTLGSTIGISGGITGTGNLVIQSNAASGGANSSITFSGTTLNFNGTITNSGTTTGTNANTTISAVIGPLVTGVTQNSTNSSLILSGANTYTGATTVSLGQLQFNSAGAIGGTGRSVTVATGATVRAGYAIDNAFLNRLVENSNAFTISTGADSANNLDLSSATGATLPNAGLYFTGGAVGTGTAQFYTGTITPGGNTFRVAVALKTSFSQALTGAGNSLVLSPGPTLTNGGNRLILTAAPTYSGTTLVKAGTILELGSVSVAGLTARSITVETGGSITANTGNTLLGRLAETSNTFSINAGSTANNFDLSNGGAGAYLPNASIGGYAQNNGAGTYTGTITPADNIYRLGSNNLTFGNSSVFGMANTNALTDNGAIPRSLVATGRMQLTGANNYSGDTTITAPVGGGITSLFLGNNLSMQNSALDTGSAGGFMALNAGITTPTLGGLKGSRNLATVINSNYSILTALTLNPGTGVTATYSGVIANGAAGMTLTKTGLGTQVFSNTNTYTGGTNVNAGTLRLSGAFNLPATGTLAVNANGTFSLADGTARATTGATTGVGLNLATGAIMAFDWNAGSLDSFTTTGTATSAGNVGIAISNTSPTGSGATLITAAATSTLNTANYFLVNNTNYTATLSKTATTVSIGAQTPVTAPTLLFWQGNKVLGTSTAGVDNAFALSTGAVSNWSTAVGTYTATGVVPGSTADVIFSTTTTPVQQSAVLGAAMTVKSVTFNDSTAVTIGGSNGLTLMSTVATAGTGTAGDGSAITVTSAANAANTISAPVALGASQTWNIASGKTLTVSGIVSGAFGLTKADTGTLTSSAFNTFTGPITINGGTLDFSATGTGTLYASTQVNINGASILRIGAVTGNQDIYNGRNYTFDSTGGGSILVSTGNYNAVSTPFSITTLGGAQDTIGLITTSGTFGFNLGATVATFNVALGSDATSDLTVTPIIANTGSVLKTGTGRLTFTGANTYTGGTTINAGTLRVSGGSAIVNTGLVTLANVAGATFQVVGSETIGALTGGGATGGAVSIDASQTLSLSSGTQAYAGTVSGAGTLTNSGAFQTMNGALSQTGGVNVTSGVLTLGSSSNTYTGTTLISAAAAGILVTANGALGAIGAGNGTTVTGAGASTAGALGFSGSINYSTAEMITGSGVGHVGAVVGFTDTQRGFIQSVSGNNTFAGDIVVNAGGVSRIGTQNGAQLTLTGAITQASGNILFRAGNTAGDFVTLSNAGNSFGGDSTVFTGATVGNYAGVRLGITNGLPTNLTISGLTGTNGSALDLAGFNQTLNGLIAGVGGLSIINMNTGTPSALTLNPTANKSSSNTLILGGGALGVINVVKDGSFTQTLTGANTYTGTTTLAAGVLNAGSAETAGVSGPLGNSAAANPGSIVMSGGTLQYSAANQNDYSGRFSIAASQAYKVDTNGQDVTWATALVSAGGTFSKSGLGTLTLTNAGNTYSGVTSITGGVLSIAASGNLGDATGSNSLAIDGGTLKDTGAGVDLGVNRAVAIGAGGATVEVTGANDLTITGAISGTGNTLTKTGTGTLDLDGVQTYGTLKTQAGTTNLNGAFTGGIVNANATTNFTVSQTFDALNIGTVPLAGLGGGAGSAVVPEPGSIGLLLVGALGLAVRRRRAA